MAKIATNFTGTIPETGDSFESATLNTTGSLEGIDTKLGELGNGKLESGGYTGTAQDLKDEIDLKAPISNATFTGNIALPTTTSIGSVSSTEISYLDGVTSNIQAQITACTEAVKYKIYNTVAEMQADNANITLGMRVKLLGYYSKNDCNEFELFISSTNNYGISVGSLFANYVYSPNLNARNFGLKGDGTTDNTTLDENMHNYYSTLSLNFIEKIKYINGTFVSDYIPTQWFEYEYDKAIVKKTTGEKRQTYVNTLKKYIEGQEYMYAWQKAYYTNSVANTDNYIVFAGDSTTSGVYVKGTGHVDGGDGKITDHFQESCDSNGYRRVKVINGGNSGSTTVMWSTTPRVGENIFVEEHIANYPNMSCYVVRYGLNDGLTNNTTTFANALELGLQKLRAFKTLENLSIVLMTPNTSNMANKDELWIEKIRPIIKFMAKKYKCVYIDTYGYFSDSRSGNNLWNDTIHPDTYMFSQINNLLEDIILKPLNNSTYKTNKFKNQPYADKVLLSTDTEFNYGLTFNRAMTTHGFPLDGFVATFKNADGVLFQINNEMSGVRVYFRNGLGSTWQAWQEFSRFGTNQVWANVLSNRTIGSAYTNTGGKVRFVNVVATSTSAGTISATVGGVTLYGSGASASGNNLYISFVVPVLGTYAINSGNYTLNQWQEFV